MKEDCFMIYSQGFRAYNRNASSKVERTSTGGKGSRATGGSKGVSGLL